MDFCLQIKAFNQSINMWIKQVLKVFIFHIKNNSQSQYNCTHLQNSFMNISHHSSEQTNVPSPGCVFVKNNL